MYIIICIIISIIILEFYIIIKNSTYVFEPQINSKKDINIEKKTDNFLLDEYIVIKDKKIQHKPGQIYIKDDYNIFINTDNYNTLMKKGYIYSIEVPFELEILNLLEENIVYYYKDY